MRRTIGRLIVPLLLYGAATPAPAEEDSAPPYPISEERTPCASHDPLRRPFFGDTHVHTAYSFDASTQDTRNTPRDAYRFARGGSMGIQPYDDEGRPLRTIRLARPLDFVAVTDHAELLGEVHLCTTPGSSGYRSILCWIHRNVPSLAFQIIAARSMVLKSRWGICGDDASNCLEAATGVWSEIQAAAEEAYDRSAACRFTSFVGYEWTATVGAGNNLHHNVVFRNRHVPAAPISWLDTPSAFDLFEALQAKCVDAIPGCDAVTIPHNSNLSGGLMFESSRMTQESEAGKPIDAEEARLRERWEPLFEVMQHKGDSECALGAGSSDEECGFEKLPYDRFGAKFSWFVEDRPAGASSFLRFALKQGLRHAQKLGANPFRYGVIASTDTHVAAPGLAEERGHPGHGGAGLAAGSGVPEGFPDDLEFSPGGLAVLWAEENSRDALFAAMRRREAYGTSGTRPVVRFFGGWDYPEDLCGSDDFVAQGYAKGVPMGGELPPPPPERPDPAPQLAVWALQDPGTATAPGTPLQRIQIVKGWIEDGALRERVVDVAGGENGASVDRSSCVPRGAGAASLCTVWRDPDFDPRSPAFYYARVLENPTCRWSQYVCNAAGVVCSDPGTVPEALAGCCAESHRPVIQERAWTSPIWFEP